MNSSQFSSKIDHFRKLQDELDESTARLQDTQVSYPTVQYAMEGFSTIEKEIEQLVSVSHNKYLMSEKKIAFFGDTNKVMVLDIKKNEWQIKTINNNQIINSSPSRANG